MVNGRDEAGSAVATLDAAVRFGRIEDRSDRILILAAGPSLSKVDMNRIATAKRNGVHVITVNAAVKACAFANDWFTLDFDKRTRTIAAGCRSSTRTVVAIPDDFGTPNARVPAHRCRPPTRPLYLRRLEGNGPLKAKSGLSNDPGSIHTGNSAYGALGLAWLMKPSMVGLLGLDGTTYPGWPTNHQPRRLDHLNSIFSTALPQLRENSVSVMVGNPESLVNCFPRLSADELIDWIVS